MNQKDHVAIRRSPYFAALTPSDFKWAWSNVTVREWALGDAVIREGECSPGLLIVLDGAVKIAKTAPNGKELILRLVHAVDSFNEVSAYDEGPCPATVIAIQSSHVACVSAPVFRELMERNSAVTVHLLQTYVGRLRCTTALAGDLALFDVTSRVAKALDFFTKASNSDEFTLRQDQLAGIVGTKRETVSRALRDLELRGALTRKRHTVVIQSREILSGAMRGGPAVKC